MLLPLRLHLVLWEDLAGAEADRALRREIEATGEKHRTRHFSELELFRRKVAELEIDL